MPHYSEHKTGGLENGLLGQPLPHGYKYHIPEQVDQVHRVSAAAKVPG